jgi:hypothetical protein
MAELQLKQVLEKAPADATAVDLQKTWAEVTEKLPK